jgi:hypothetical protein
VGVIAAAAAVLGSPRARAEGSYETVVTAAPPADEPVSDRTASGSVVLPADEPARVRRPRHADGRGARRDDDAHGLVRVLHDALAPREQPRSGALRRRRRSLNIAEGGAVDVSTLPLGDVERVEVYRGQSPIAFGESALGGIVAITTRTPGTPSLTARAGTGSFGAYFGDVTAGGRAGRLRLYAGAHALTSTGAFPYPNDNATPLNPPTTRSRRASTTTSARPTARCDWSSTSWAAAP